MTKLDVACVLWVFGLAFAMVFFAMPHWEDEPRPRITVVKARAVPVLIDGPKELRR